jgi:hypothetical protein
VTLRKSLRLKLLHQIDCRAEQINQMLEVSNQMKVMGFNVFTHIMIAADPFPVKKVESIDANKTVSCIFVERLNQTSHS